MIENMFLEVIREIIPAAHLKNVQSEESDALAEAAR